MQFKVPQFLDIEDKIFGPFTFREFIYLAGGGGLCFVLYKLLGFTLGAIPILAIGGLTLSLIFYRQNNKPFINMIESGFNYFLRDKLYIWERRTEVLKNRSQDLSGENKRKELGKIQRLGGNKLRDLAWSLDILDLNKHVKN